MRIESAAGVDPATGLFCPVCWNMIFEFNIAHLGQGGDLRPRKTSSWILSRQFFFTSSATIIYAMNPLSIVTRDLVWDPQDIVEMRIIFIIEQGCSSAEGVVLCLFLDGQ